MIRFSRYILVLTAVVVASITLPAFYWTVFEKVPRAPQVFYSCVTNDFIMVEGSKRVDPSGREFGNDEYEKSLPFMFYRQLMADGNMPDSLNGIKMEAPAISRASSFYRYTPKKLNMPVPSLWPMLESQSGKVNLAMPDDYFRIGKRMEFIVARTNKVNEEKSELFTSALKDKGFVFPAKIIAGIPTTRKSVDEGYFVTDSDGSLFQIKMIKGQPFVVRIETPEKLDIVYIEAVDLRSREFYCYVITRSQGIYLVLNEVYDLQRLPVDGFNPEVHTFRMSSDLFNKCITVSGENWFQSIAVDDVYDVVGTHGEEWAGLYERADGKIFASIFPFEIRMSDENSAFVNFFFRPSPGMKWIAVNILSVVALILILRKKGWKLGKNVIDLVIVACTGLFGLIATQFIPNKFPRINKTTQKQ